MAQVWPEGNALNISWDTAGDDTLSYELYLKASGLWSDIPFVIFDHPTHSFDHTDLVDGIEYFYKLRLKSVLGQYSEFSEPVSAVPQDTMPPDAPTNLQLADKTYYSIDITWAESTASDIEGYNVYRSNVSNPKDKGVPINDKELIRDTYYTDTGLDEGTSYYYMITGVDEVPNESPGSSFFEARTYLSIEYPQRPSINRSQPDIAIPEDTYDDSSINLIEWFSDINNDVLSFYCVDQKHINVTINQDTGSVLLKPEQNWNGQEKLTFFAFDGVYQTSDDVIVSITAVNDPPNKPEIITPKDGIELVSGTKLDLKASCTDPDLMYGDGLTFSWSSNIDGMLGEGAILSGVSLSIGQHLIKVAVSDSENKTASRSINVTILASSDHQDEKNINDDSTIVIFVGGIIIVIIIVLILILFLYQRKKKQAGLKNTGYAESQYASIEPATRSKYPVQKRVKRPKRIRREETFESDDEDEMEFIDWSEDEE